MTRPTVRIVALLAVLALAVSACGGGSSDESSSSGGESLQGSSSGGSGSSGDSGSTGTADVEFGGDFDGSVNQCLDIAQAFGIIAMGPAMSLIAGDQSIEDVRAQLSGETFTVPAELEDSFRVLDNAYAEIEQALDGTSYTDALGNPEAMQRIEEATEVYDTPEVQAALEEVGTFLEENCSDFNAGDFGG